MAIDTLSPDVLSEEVSGNNSQIPNASTSSFAMVGYSPRGPEDQALNFSSFQEFSNTFGGLSTKSINGYSAAAYFANGGNSLWFSRKMHSDAAYASGAFPSTWNVRASGRGIWANGAVIVMSGNPNFYNSVSGSYSAFDLQVSLIDPNTGLLAPSESYEALDLVDPTDPEYIVNVLTEESQDVVFTANGGGIPSALQPSAHNGVAFATGVSGQNLYAHNVSGAGLPILAGSFAILTNSVITAKDNGAGLLIAVGGGPAVSGQVDYIGGAVSYFVSPATSGGEVITANFIQPAAASTKITLAGGLDGSNVLSSDILNVGLQATKQGIYALDVITDQFALDLPDYAGDPTTAQGLLDYSAYRPDADVVIPTQPPQGVTPQVAANYKRNVLGSVSSFGAMYYPWIKVPDALNKNRAKTIPPSGHVAGRFAYTDLNANVGKAPAGVNRGQLSYFLGVERILSKGDRDIVYQAQINPIRSDSEVGNAIWGNKTLAVSGDYTDVNIRRLFIYLRKVQNAGLLDIVFEDVGPTTWGIVKARLDTFLQGLYLNNVIGSGVTNQNQAFKVVCDATNNPPAIQKAKTIIVDEYIKPNLAAEIIHLRLQRVFDASQL